MLWIDKYAPQKFEEFENFQHLNKIVENPPHMLFYGPPGSGKKSLVKQLLKKVFGDSVEKIKIEQRSYKLLSKKVVDLTIMASDNFIQFDAEETKQNDRMIIQELFKEIVSGITVFSEKPFKIMVIENLSTQAQHALRRTMENFSHGCRIILITKSLSEIVDPLISRFLCIRVPSPTREQIFKKLKYICENENVKYTDSVLNLIIKHSGRNWMKAISKLQMMCMENTNIKTNEIDLSTIDTIEIRDWNILVSQICKCILDKQSTSNFLKIRNYVYDIIGHCIDPRQILKKICIKLTQMCDENIKNEICSIASKYEHKMILGSKSIFHLEAFILNAALIFHKHTINTTSRDENQEIEI